MEPITIDTGDECARPARFPVRLPVAIGETADEALPWGIVSDVSAGGLYVRTCRSQPPGALRLWFVDGRELRPVDVCVVRHGSDGVAVSYDDESFYRWAFERVSRP